MRRLIKLAGVCLFALAMIAGPVTADPEFLGSEVQERDDLPCPAERDGSVPENQEAPQEGDCEFTEDEAADIDGVEAGDWNPDAVYSGKYWSNEVECADTPASTPVANAYVGFNPSVDDGWVGAGICNDDGSGVPVEGRAGTYGSFEQGGFSAFADGTKNNEPEVLQGYARADATADGPEVYCGDDDGKRDFTSRSSGDGMDQCG